MPMMLKKKSANNVNQMENAKYGYAPKFINENCYWTKNSGLYLTLSELKNQNKLQTDSINLIKNSMSKKKGKFRENLDLGENVLLLTEKIKKRSAPGIFYKSSDQDIAFFYQSKGLCYTKQKKYRCRYILLVHWHKEQTFKRTISKAWTIDLLLQTIVTE